MEYVFECPDALPKDLCDRIIEKFDRDPNKSAGELSLGHHFNIKKCVDLHIDALDDPEWADIEEQINSHFQEAFVKYSTHLKVIMGEDVCMSFFGRNYPMAKTGSQIQCYEAGDYFKWHVDQVPSKNDRKIAFIIYLNTLNEEDGGCTEFYNTDRRIRPVAGKIMFFPSTWTYPHRGEVIKQNVKYIITGFLVEDQSVE